MTNRQGFTDSPMRPSLPLRRRVWLLRAVYGSLAVLIAVFLGHALHSQWQRLDTQMIAGNAGLLVLALLIYAVGLWLLPINSWLLQQRLGGGLTWRVVWRLFFISQVMKYLPGSIWALPGRAYLYTRHQVPPLLAGGVVMIEVLLMLAGAGVISLLALPVLLVGDTQWALIAGGVASTGLAGGLGLLLLYRFMPRRAAQLYQALANLRVLPLGWLAALVAGYAANWLLLGAGFALFVRALHPALSPAEALFCVGLHAFGWMIGFVVILTPGGLGVRDVILVVGVAAFAPQPVGVVAAVLARLAWMLSEVIHLGITTLLTTRPPAPVLPSNEQER